MTAAVEVAHTFGDLLADAAELRSSFWAFQGNLAEFPTPASLAKGISLMFVSDREERGRDCQAMQLSQIFKLYALLFLLCGSLMLLFAVERQASAGTEHVRELVSVHASTAVRRSSGASVRIMAEPALRALQPKPVQILRADLRDSLRHVFRWISRTLQNWTERLRRFFLPKEGFQAK